MGLSIGVVHRIWFYQAFENVLEAHDISITHGGQPCFEFTISSRNFNGVFDRAVQARRQSRSHMCDIVVVVVEA